MNTVSGADALSGAVAPSIPEQHRRGGAALAQEPPPGPDPLDHTDPHLAADAAAVENLLRCWVRETNAARPDGAVLRLTLAASRLVLLVPVAYWSPTGMHRFGRPALAAGPPDAPAVDAPTLAALLTREAAHHATRHQTGRPMARTPDATFGGPGSAAGVGPYGAALFTDGQWAPDGPAAYPGQTASNQDGATAVEPPAGRSAEPFAPFATVVPPATEATGDAGIYPVAGAQGSAYGEDRAPSSAYGGLDGACEGDRRAAGPESAYGATHGAVYGAPRNIDPVRPGPHRAVPTPSTEAQHGAASERAAADAVAFVGRVADSVRRTATFLADRRSAPADPSTGGLFLAGEQALLLGHPLHPTPKSREGLSDAEARAYSPEQRGSFPLHWLAVQRSVLAADSAWTERGRPVSADRLVASVIGAVPPLPDGTVPLPLHPWQAREVGHRGAVQALVEAGLVRDLGPCGDPWHPTSSVRTVYQPAGRAMLKLSLGLRITNSRRENLRKELLRGVEVHRLLRSGLAEEWRAACPGGVGFDIVRDPAWLGVDGPDGEPVPGLDVVVRHNPFTAEDDVVCLAGLVSPRPWPHRTGLRSHLAHLVERLAARTGRSLSAVSTEWFLRYLHTVVRPVLWLDGAAGVALEAHQQNTLVLLDADGWPAGGRYRDNQGYYFRESRRAALDHRLPGIGTHSDTFVSDAITDERFAYYLGVNNVLGLIGAFGSQQLADERLLLAAFRRFLGAASREPQAQRSPLAARLLETPTLRCKANMLTRLCGLDELVGPVDTQSVYVTIANPLVTSAS
ncbi:IucA/IucC family protein [Streptomyces sp. HSW2009]|uniref:IucA/IucC family protein n=1 Tax=Streptomyces sp. HSW2009 TaxID=3142890 RepID=UPI0032EFDAD3